MKEKDWQGAGLPLKGNRQINQFDTVSLTVTSPEWLSLYKTTY